MPVCTNCNVNFEWRNNNQRISVMSRGYNAFCTEDCKKSYIKKGLVAPPGSYLKCYNCESNFEPQYWQWVKRKRKGIKFVCSACSSSGLTVKDAIRRKNAEMKRKAEDMVSENSHRILVNPFTGFSVCHPNSALMNPF